MDMKDAWGPNIGLSDEALARRAKAKARSIEVFGDDDWQPCWFLKNDPALGLDETGLPLTPAGLAGESEEGFQRVMALLDEFAKLVKPSWKPKIPGQRRAGAKRSRR